MPVGVRLRTSVESKLKVLNERKKKDRSANFSKRKNQRNRQIAEGDDIESDTESRLSSIKTRRREAKFGSVVEGKRKQLASEENPRRSHVKGNFEYGTRFRERRNVIATTKKGDRSEATVSRRKDSYVKRKVIDEDDYDVDEGRDGRSYILKRQGLKNDASYHKKGDVGGRGSRADAFPVKHRSKQPDSLETSYDKCGSKGKKIGTVTSTGGHDVGSGDEVSEELTQKKDKGDQIVQQKHQRFQTRVLDKSGKKIRVNRKALAGDTAETSRPLKKKKRVIKIDPYDISNKRLDDSAFDNEKVNEGKDEMSKNAQFRAIQPSPAILSFVEDNLLGRRRLIELQNAGYNVKLSAPLDNAPFSTSTERERIEENAFRNKLEFFAAAKVSSSFPPPMLPEIAFAGRSNVGKSSLLNALTRQWGVVRTSDKPGLTQTINFFSLASKLCLVDLPGYGFAYAKEEVKDAWEELVKEYVSTRVGLQRVCVLIDTKWGMKPRDHELIDLMERSQTPYQIVLTKTDLVFPIDVARRAMQIQENLKSNNSVINPVMMVSSKSGAGVRSLRTVLAKLSRFIKP
ncbi:hypothetical protein Cni_G05411 [Canna indica]|uniref:EngB-type G domain-containing protein n=1 Tax=Canna indica TaxID=4628 RepID=A0AAQ3JWZ4_9LILI|nr:hypothetical protein Cni_G05411 [Canna indica]